MISITKASAYRRSEEPCAFVSVPEDVGNGRKRDCRVRDPRFIWFSRFEGPSEEVETSSSERGESPPGETPNHRETLGCQQPMALKVQLLQECSKETSRC